MYVGSWDGHMYAFDSASGELLWRYETGGEVYSSPVWDGGVVYFGSNDGHLYALDAVTGESRWRYETGGEVWSSPAVSGGMVFVGSTDGSVYALGGPTGELVWRFETEAFVVSSPTLSEGMVYVGSRDGHLYALDETTGELVWSHQMPHWVESSPIVAGGTVYVLSYQQIYALDARTGRLSWRNSLHDVLLPSASLAEGVLYVTGAISGYTHALDASNGLRLHSYTGDGLSYGTVSGGVIYVGSEDGVYAHGAVAAPSGGRRPWRYQTDGEVWSPPAVSDGLAFAGSGDGYVYALVAATGEPVWKREIGGEIYATPLVDGNKVYSGSRAGQVHALEISTGRPVWEFDAESAVYDSPVIAGGLAYVYSDLGDLFALDVQTGDLIWRYRMVGHGEYAHISHMEVNQGVVYVGSFSYLNAPSLMTALEASTGDLIWQYGPEKDDRVLTAVVTDRAVFLGTSDGHVYALERSSGELIWQYDVPWSTDVERQRFAAISVDQGIVYAASEKGQVRAIKASTGAGLWEYDAEGKVFASPVTVDGVVYIGSLPDHSNRDGHVHLLEGGTGKLLRRHEAGEAGFLFVTGPGERIYIGSHDGSVSVFDSSDNEALWRYEFIQLGPLFRSSGIERGASLPAVVDGVVYVGSRDGGVYALTQAVPAISIALDKGSPDPRPSPQTESVYAAGQELWRFDLPDGASTAPTVAEGVVFIATDDSVLHALDGATGHTMWTYRAGHWITSSPVVVDGAVYFGSWDTKLYAMSATSGEILWSYYTGDPISTSPAVADGIVYVGTGTTHYALSADDGNLLWSYQAGANVSEFTPLVVGDVVYAGSLDGHVAALDATTGGLLWDKEVGEEFCSGPAAAGNECRVLLSPPAVAGESMYLGTDQGTIIALHARTGDLLWQFKTSGKVPDVPVVGDGLVYVHSVHGHVYALEASSGELAWEYNTGRWVVSVGLVGPFLYLRTGIIESTLVLSASSGEPIAPRYDSGGSESSLPTLAERTVYKMEEVIGGEHTNLYARDPVTGNVLWHYRLEGSANPGAPSINGTVYIVSRVNNKDRYLYALSGPGYR